MIEPLPKDPGAVTAEANQWTVKVKDLESGTTSNEIFDKIMVCNGHYFQPNLPMIQGQDQFKGLQMHSHDYRVPDVFANKIVVVVGAGPSGMDLALDISKTADKVILSHHSREPINTVFPDNVIQVSRKTLKFLNQRFHDLIL